MTESLADGIRVGPAGWQYPDWEGIVYSSAKRHGFDALAFIASYFSVIEINSTFYRSPAPHTSRSWAERTEHLPRFRFTLKALHRFTHGRDVPDATEIDTFRRGIQPLYDAGRLSAVLLQFPWSFRDGVTSRRRIATLAARFAPMPIAIELRHGSWGRENAWHHLASTGLTVCGIDQPVIGDSLPPGRFLVGDAGAYFRLHGRNYRNWFSPSSGRDERYDYLYSREQLTPWVDSIKRTAAAGAPVNVILNNHFRGQAPANAFEVMAMLTGAPVRVPSPLVRTHQRLSEVAAIDDLEGEAEGWLFDLSAAEDNQEKNNDDATHGDQHDVSR